MCAAPTPPAPALIQIEQLMAALEGPSTGAEVPIVLDVRWSVGRSGRAEYAAGHMPGAVFVDLDSELASAPGSGGRHPLPRPEDLQSTLRRAGIRQDTAQIVVYDDGQQPGPAARAWWLLRWAGLTSVSVLDGGWRGWLAAGGESSTAMPEPPPGDVVVAAGCMPVLDARGAARLAGKGQLFDARSAARYRGDNEPIDGVAGHVPGAMNIEAGSMVDADGRLLAAQVLADRFATFGVRPGRRAGAYCGSGVTAAALVLGAVVAGMEPPALYVGSWSEWITDPTRPVATGGDPG